MCVNSDVKCYVNYDVKLCKESRFYTIHFYNQEVSKTCFFFPYKDKCFVFKMFSENLNSLIADVGIFVFVSSIYICVPASTSII